MDVGARLGYAASGVLHLVLAWLALQLAFGGNGGQADQTGALAALASTTFGAALLWVLFVGFALLGLWQVTEVFARSGSKKLKPAAKAVVYVVLAVSTVSVLYGPGRTPTSRPRLRLPQRCRAQRGSGQSEAWASW